ncbi:MAG: tetratricopeptide repeat protein [Verrucomicrobiota bacterium]|jgi:tetratricopeptide (TPR) repeat protein
MADVNKTGMEFMEQFEPDLFWQTHGRKILWGLVGALAIGVVVVRMQRQAAEREEVAAARLAQTTEPLDLQQLAHEYKGKEIGAQAYLRLANLQAQAGHLPEALAAYQEFLTVYPQHSLAAAAQLGQATSLETLGKLEDAKIQYARLATRPNSYTVISAKLGEARCAEALGRTKEAIQLYEELVPAITGTQWALPVAIRLEVLARSQEPAGNSSGTAAPLPSIMLK